MEIACSFAMDGFPCTSHRIALHFIFARTATHVEIHRTACIASKDHNIDDDGVQRRLLLSTMWMPDGVWLVPATQARARGDTLLIALLPSQRLRGPSPHTPHAG